MENASRDNEMLTAALRQVPTAVSIGNEHHQIVFRNKAFHELFGRQPEDEKSHLPKTLFDDPDQHQEILRLIESENHWHGETMMQDSAGKIFPVELKVNSLEGEDGRTIAYIANYADISKREKIEQESQIQKEYLSTLRSVSLGMFRRLNLSSLLNAIIERASRLTGIPDGFLYLFQPDEKQLEIMAACGRMKESIGFRIDPESGFAGTIFKTGDPLILANYQEWPHRLENDLTSEIFAIIGIPLISGARIEGVIGLCHDTPSKSIDPATVDILEEFAAIAQIAIDNTKLFESMKAELEKRIQLETERKKMEERLYQSQRLESIGTLAGGIAHDFNNILSSIIGFTQIAQSEVEKDSLTAQDLNEIYTASLRAKDLVSQILTFARQSEEKVHAIRVSLIAKEVLKFIRSTIPSSISIRQEIISGSRILADPSQVYQIFLNLFTNAAQAMGSNEGELHVRIEERLLKSKQASLEPGNYVYIEISDTGSGISENNLPHIFEPYFTTKKVGEGTGLGLSVVHGAVKSMGGEIFVESMPGKGTTFTIYLPVTETQEQVVEMELEANFTPQGKNEHLLFVDDEKNITEVGRRLLEAHHFQVTAMTDSLKLLEVFESGPDQFQAVLTDMTMPEMTGEEIAAKIKQIRPDIPVILCTGHHQYASEMDYREKGIDFICKKPFSKQKTGRSGQDGH